MDVNQVRFGSYSIGNSQTNQKRNEKPSEEAILNAQSGVNIQSKDEETLDALKMLGMQNMVQVNAAGKKEVNPVDYLSADRISDIEAMMGEFESGVETITNAIEAEFPGAFADDKKYALAASIFAAE